MERTKVLMEKFVYEEEMQEKFDKIFKWFKKRGIAFLMVGMLRSAKITDKIEHSRHSIVAQKGDWEKYPMVMQLMLMMYMSSAAREVMVDKLKADSIFRDIVEEEIDDFHKMAKGNE